MKSPRSARPPFARAWLILEHFLFSQFLLKTGFVIGSWNRRMWMYWGHIDNYIYNMICILKFLYLGLFSTKKNCDQTKCSELNMTECGDCDHLGLNFGEKNIFYTSLILCAMHQTKLHKKTVFPQSAWVVPYPIDFPL